jgi:hypothetical protein
VIDREPARYGPEFGDLLKLQPNPELGPGQPSEEHRIALSKLNHGSFPERVIQPDWADACLAGMWLLFDFLDESHSISQRLSIREGSYWHAIMHRREPDAWNSKYWFRRVGLHPIFEQIAPGYDPFTFIDRCEAVRATGTPEESYCRAIQRREWQLLFDWCFQQATATG